MFALTGTKTNDEKPASQAVRDRVHEKCRPDSIGRASRNTASSELTTQRTTYVYIIITIKYAVSDSNRYDETFGKKKKNRAKVLWYLPNRRRQDRNIGFWKFDGTRKRHADDGYGPRRNRCAQLLHCMSRGNITVRDAWKTDDRRATEENIWIRIWTMTITNQSRKLGDFPRTGGGGSNNTALRVLYYSTV